MNQFPPNRMAIAALGVLALFVCAERAQATDISGTISSTLTIFDDSQLVGDVSCTVPLQPSERFEVWSRHFRERQDRREDRGARSDPTFRALGNPVARKPRSHGQE